MKIKSKKKQGNQPTRRDKINEALNSNISKIYLNFVGFMSSFLLIIITLGIIFRPPVSIEEYELGRYFPLSNRQIAIENKYKSEDDSTILFTVIVDSTSNIQSELTELFVKTKFIGAKSNEVDTYVFKGSNRYYEVAISNLPETWKAIRLELSLSENGDFKSFDFQRLPNNETYLVLKDDIIINNHTTELRSIQREIDTAEEQKTVKLPSELEELIAINAKLVEEKQELITLQKFQTSSEKQRSNLKITQIENSIIANNQKQNGVQKQMEEVEEKLKLLNEKLSEYAKTYQINISEINLKN